MDAGIAARAETGLAQRRRFVPLDDQNVDVSVAIEITERATAAAERRSRPDQFLAPIPRTCGCPLSLWVVIVACSVATFL